MAITTKGKAIKYLSAAYVGTSHDFSIFKTEFPPIEGWFRKFNLKVDLGYLGIAKEYECKSLSIPHKRTKNKPLAERQKCENKQVATERTCVENSFAGLKRLRVLSDRLRLHDFEFYNFTPCSTFLVR
jgi:hypothetical protein